MANLSVSWQRSYSLRCLHSFCTQLPKQNNLECCSEQSQQQEEEAAEAESEAESEASSALKRAEAINREIFDIVIVVSLWNSSGSSCT